MIAEEKDFGPFDFLAEKDPEFWGRFMEELWAEKGCILYHPPINVTPMYQIQSGLVKIGGYSEEGKEVCYDILQPGEFFGNLRYLDGKFFEFAKVLKTVKLRKFDSDYFKYLVVHEPTVSEWFNKQVVKRWCRAEERLFSIRSLNPDERVSRVVSFYGNDLISESKKKTTIMNFISIQDIADLTGLTRQTTSKILRSLNR
jgi:CRP-like cAMP-binding protein